MDTPLKSKINNSTWVIYRLHLAVCPPVAVSSCLYWGIIMTKLRDMREKFFCVNNEYLNGYAAKCGIYATGIYTELCRHASKEQTSFPSISHIAGKLGISRPSVIEGIRQLENFKIIIAERKEGKVTEYKLTDKSVWSLDQSTTFTSQPRLPVNHVDHTSQPDLLVPVNVVDPKNTNIEIPIKKTNNTVGFDSFWKSYPKKEGKGACKKIWARLRPSKQLLEVMLGAVEDQKSTEKWKKDGGQFIPMPATWLNQERWEDEIKKTKTIDDLLREDKEREEKYANKSV